MLVPKDRASAEPSAQAGAQPPEAEAQAPMSPATASSQRLVEPGFEIGFTHCCGDFDYVMQVDCGEGLLRCYENKTQGWKQTYGRNCKRALGTSCYERGCLEVCE